MWLDALESTNHTLSQAKVLLDWMTSLSVLYDSLRTFHLGHHSQNLWHNSWVVGWSKPTLVSSFGTPLRSGQIFHSTCIQSGCLGNFVWHDDSPSYWTPLVCSLSDSACVSSAESSSLFKLGVEHPTISHIAPCLWFSLTNGIDGSSKKEGGLSLARMDDLILLSHGANPLRHICTTSSSSMYMLIDLRSPHNSLIFKV